ncbi:glycosyltransferase family 2 protein [Dysgonomonas sp. 511]|uniref:glycosyltransferase family 2 protein n=1 Tax=Dysgonomonas sp. 511 TaxID=2302930 RepID=UPI0013CF4382|nr:glycosyltransferase family 2 protein [Dysgonomonas sp. 511]NDV79327.1 glycosyltransferase family 2 protein [Dysgonomonas sp. 511]
MTKPLVSVLMPCYNAEEYVEDAISSILKQTYPNLEIIAIDDCSTDSTGAILRRMAASDSRLNVIKNPENLKLIKTLNKGITLCNGEYIARMDADDISMHQRLELQVEFLETHRDHDIVSTMFYTFRSMNPGKLHLYTSPLRDEEIRAFILFKPGICHPAVMIRRRVFTELGLSFEQEYLHVEDYALWSKAIYLTRLANLPQPLLLYRVHRHQVSALYEDLQLENKKKVFEIHCRHLGLPTDDEAMDIYASVAESVPSQSSFAYVDKCEALMLRIIEINGEKPFCDDKYLRYMMSMHWLRLCANSQLGLKVITRLKNSPLYKKENYTTRDLVILYTKCIFRLKYRKSFIYKVMFR